MNNRLITKPINVSRRAIFRIEKWLYRAGVLKTERLTFPDFLCIGSQKAGTTWLYENLRCHPGLFLPDRKELNYFSSKYRFYGLPLSAYSDYFKNTHGVKGEVTPCANLPLRRIRFIKNIMPDLKLILIIRNPIDRMWASALMYLVRAQKKRFEDISDSDFYQLFQNQDLFSRGEYDRILRNWRGVFPSEQLHICFYHDLLNDPKRFLKDIFHFLNISEPIDWSNFPIQDTFNKSPEYALPSHLRAYLEGMYKQSIEEFKEEFPEIVKYWIN
ncbi:sulfotransferase [Fulvivirga sp. 29W222]|uniref:Sulfotransferase n=1 Tax=Fulvivirga marina TaxID=2494733 RepID=A0A937G0Y9_9BACT|nr:sulfotransferase [Fulvivirga marina]MBL6449800.1 sulfotransferase [Fulvivirga marina]